MSRITSRSLTNKRLLAENKHQFYSISTKIAERKRLKSIASLQDLTKCLKRILGRRKFAANIIRQLLILYQTVRISQAFLFTVSK